MSDEQERDREERFSERDAEAEFAPRGCCTVVTDEGSTQHPDVTEARCEELAFDAGGKPLWEPGPCR